MLNEMRFPQVYLVCGYTDMQREIDGLAAIVQQNYRLEPCSGSLFCSAEDDKTDLKLYCGRRMDFC